MLQKTLSELGEILSDEHLRQRIRPEPGDSLYLHLSDLLLALRNHSTDEKLTILDFGAGSSPYRTLYPNSDYRRADFPLSPEDDLHYELDESFHVGAADESFDLILSTQVLEHVERPADYLKECLRLLRPGGQLIVTTHGIYPDHPCPLDLHRWTADGLVSLCRQSGFEVASAFKLTTGPRALLFLYDLQGRHLHRKEPSLFAAVFAMLHKLHARLRGPLHRWADRFFPDSRVVPTTPPAHDIYINILVHATKPSASFHRASPQL